MDATRSSLLKRSVSIGYCSDIAEMMCRPTNCGPVQRRSWASEPVVEMSNDEPALLCTRTCLQALTSLPVWTSKKLDSDSPLICMGLMASHTTTMNSCRVFHVVLIPTRSWLSHLLQDELVVGVDQIVDGGVLLHLEIVTEPANLQTRGQRVWVTSVPQIYDWIVFRRQLDHNPVQWHSILGFESSTSMWGEKTSFSGLSPDRRLAAGRSCTHYAMMHMHF